MAMHFRSTEFNLQQAEEQVQLAERSMTNVIHFKPELIWARPQLGDLKKLSSEIQNKLRQFKNQLAALETEAAARKEQEEQEASQNQNQRPDRWSTQKL